MALTPCGAQTDAQGLELARHGSAQFPAACYLDNVTRNPVPWHWHTELEALAVAEGTAVVAAGTGRFTLRQGQGMFINSGVLHAAWSPEPSGCRLHSAVFHPRLVGGGEESVFWTDYLRPLLEDKGCPCILLDPAEPWQREALQALAAAWQACAEEPPGYVFWTREALSRLVFLLSSRPTGQARPRSERSQREAGRVKVMLEYIHGHYDGEVDTASIARSAMVSQSECLRCFRAVIGQAPIQYVLNYRIQKAAELLSASSLSVAEIGARCGFPDASYFAKTFRSRKGCSPSAYRKAGR